MGVKYTHTKFAQKFNGGVRERVSQLADLGFNLYPKLAKSAPFLRNFGA